jgi:cysteine desulfurase family protein (TIGR01976 family)
MPINATPLRAEFPALSSGHAYLDGPGGTQVPRQVIDRMVDYLIEKNANTGGAFVTSQDSDALILEARSAFADFINAPQDGRIIFGPNMTSLTFSLSRALALDLKPEDEILVTRLDHNANVAPWMAIARDRGCTIRQVDFDVEDCTLRVEQFDQLLTKRTKLVAVGYASNAVGTINPVAEIVQKAHRVGALCYVDAVHYAPHGPIDVQSLGCDFLVFSVYKIFGPHLGVLFGREELLSRIQAYKVRPASDEPPGKFETGTQNHEGIAGALGAIEYLTKLGERFGGEHAERYAGAFGGRRLLLKQAMASVRAYESELTRTLIPALESIQGLRIYGITDSRALDRRTPTVSFTLPRIPPRRVAEQLAQEDIFVWDGNYLAQDVTERLDLEKSGGMVRVGLVHYNTASEIERLVSALHRIATHGGSS